MDLALAVKALVMGIVEGVTEFLPVSSTGHLIVVGRAIGFPEDIEVSFEIFIQLGAILAVVVDLAPDLAGLARRATYDRDARRLVASVAVAFLPAGILGYLFNARVEEVLFNPIGVAVALVAGGAVMLLAERRAQQGRVRVLEDIGMRRALGVGCAQVASLWPGVSRSAATIVGGMALGLDRPTAVRFSFYLSIPTMLVATVYSLVRDLGAVTPAVLPAFVVGLVASFFVALVVVRLFLGYVARRDLVPFAWYRIVAGAVMLVLVAAGVLPH